MWVRRRDARLEDAVVEGGQNDGRAGLLAAGPGARGT